LGGIPVDTRRSFAALRASKASSTCRLRTTKAPARNMVLAVSPITRLQPLEMSMVAGSLTVEKLRSAAVRRA
jgi:hypothetical protein